MPRLTAIVPATDGPATLARCLAAIEAAVEGPDELIVVDGPAHTSPAVARNSGAARATGDVLVFVDADVEVEVGAFARIRSAFDAAPELTALFGSYDDAPAGRSAVSVFRNLLHHHVHQSSPGRASTFWAGLGAVRRDAFVAAGGFVEHPIEDIELGMRLVEAGARIELDPLVQGKHLKVWTLWSMLRTDLVVRGIPWVGLLLHHRNANAGLNLGWRHRLSALASLGVLLAVVLQSILLAAVAMSALLVLNYGFYALLVRRGGPRRAIAGVVLHVLHLLVAVVALVLGTLFFAAERRRASRVTEAPVGLVPEG